MENRSNVYQLTAGLACRIILGGLFIYAGYLKAAAPAEEFAAVIEGYKIIPVSLSLWAAYVLPWAELYVGGFIAAGILTRLSITAAGGIIGVFIMALFSALARGIPLADCGCFGGGQGHSIPAAIIQDIILLFIAFVAFKHGGRKYTADMWAKAGEETCGKE